MNREKALRVVITCILLCCSYCSFAQGTSSQGKEFWTAFMSHIDAPGQISNMFLYITADENTSGKVEVADNSFAAIPFDVVAKQVTLVPIPKSAFLKNQGKFLRGLHITAEKKIAVYAHIYASSVSGATLLLPVAVLGKSYYSLNYTQKANVPNTYSSFMVIATEDNTTVEITPSQQLLDGTPEGQVMPVTLNKGEVYQGLSANDLTNTKIRSVSSVNGDCKKIAVFSGSTKIGIGCSENNFTSDNLFQQVYPTTSWGKNYITVPLKGRNYDIFRVFLSDPATSLSVNGAIVPAGAIQNNNVYEFSSNAPNNINADKPIQVIQYAVSQGKTLADGCPYDRNDMGDPEMIYLNPLEQTLDHVTLFSSKYNAIQRHFINVVIKADVASTFKLDGIAYTNFTAILNGGGYVYAQISVQQGTHTISADGGFNAIAYGFGPNESYGYSAGTNLKNLNENIVFTPLQGSGTQVDGCSDEQYKLRLSLPFQPTKIVWNFKGERPNYTDNNPVLKGTAPGSNGQIIYRYEYYQPVNFAPGDHSITAIATNPMADDCGTDVDVDFDFNIGEKPQTTFTPAPNLCSADIVVIKDNSAGGVNSVKIWWDFAQHPDEIEFFDKSILPADKMYRHQYEVTTTDKTYVIRMEAFGGTGSLCGDGYQQEVTVHGSPQVSVTEVAPMCQDANPVQLVTSHPGFTGTEVFSGPGVSTQGVFNPATSGPGTFTITYTFTANNLCPAVATLQIVVNPLPVVNAGSYMQVLEGEGAVIPAKTTIAGTYLWTPSIELDDPTALNPVSRATEDRPYRLTVTTAAGCVAYSDLFIKVLKKPIIVSAFTPNGDGVNDTWTIKYLETYPGSTVDIYNRQGEKVYSSVGYTTAWDGTYKGSALPTGVYYYIINPKNGRKTIAGNVTIIK